MPAARRLTLLLVVALCAAACGGTGTSTTAEASTTTTTQALTTSTTSTTSTSTAAPDTGPLAPLLADPVADPLRDTGSHQMRYRNPQQDEVVSQDTLDGTGTRLSLRLPDPMPTITGLNSDQMLLQVSFTEGPYAPDYQALVLYGRGLGGWNPYVVIDYASILAYLETTTDYQARRVEHLAALELAPKVFDWTGSAHFIAGVSVFPADDYFGGGEPVAAYTGEIECTFTGTLECETVSDDGILRPGDEGEDIAALQQTLAELGYYGGAGGGTYDEETEEAVGLFQRDYRLDVDGKAGPQTQRLLEEVVSGESDIVLASRQGVGEVAFGTPAAEARASLTLLFGTPDDSTGWFSSPCSGADWQEITWDGFTAIFTDRNGSRQFDGWEVNDLQDLPDWLFFAGGIRPAWRWADFEEMGARFDLDPDGVAFWYHENLSYNNGRFANPPSDPPAASARIRSFGTGTGAFVSC
ncbi:MAG: peptidoglycan-binding protein [Acidimicrobiia bacterium]|nr:peptidoglycan-binding protein [Acidimicrobiia bacterium]